MPNFEVFIFKYVDNSILEIPKDLDLDFLAKKYSKNQVREIFFQNLDIRFSSHQQQQAIRTLKFYGELLSQNQLFNNEGLLKLDAIKSDFVIKPSTHDLEENLIGESNVLAYRFATMHTHALVNPPRFASLRVNYDFKLEDLRDSALAAKSISRQVSTGIFIQEFRHCLKDIYYGLPYLNIPREIGDSIVELNSQMKK